MPRRIGGIPLTLLTAAIGGGISYVLRDEFNDTKASGEVNGSPSKPGPGTRREAGGTDTTISSGVLNLPDAAGHTLYWGRTASGYDIARKAGRVVRFDVPTLPTTGGTYCRIHDSGGARHGVYYGTLGGNLIAYHYDPVLGTWGLKSILSTYNPNADNRFALLDGAADVRYFHTDNLRTRLVWVSTDHPSSDPFVVGFSNPNVDGTIDSLRIWDTSIPALSDCAHFDVTNPVTSTEYEATSTDDQMRGCAMQIINVTAPNPLSGSLEIRWRYLDANNYCAVLVNDSGDVTWRRRLGGVNLDNTDLAAISAADAVTLYLLSTEHECRWAARVANSFVADYEPKVELGTYWQYQSDATCVVSTATDFTVTRWRSWPVQSSKYSQLARTRSGKRFLPVGDSKTNTDSWCTELKDGLNALAGFQWEQWPGQIGVGGRTVALTEDAIAAEIADRAGDSRTDHILVNLGSNDLAALPAEATWKADYRTIIEALHAWQPSATIYLAKPVLLQAAPASIPHADSATMWGYIDDLVVEYDYVSAGIDETDLEGGDGYVTNLTDTTHYTVAGQTAVAGLWQTVMGF